MRGERRYVLFVFIFLYIIILSSEGMYLPFLFAKGVNPLVVKSLLLVKYVIVFSLFIVFILKNVSTFFSRLYLFELLGVFLAIYDVVYIVMSSLFSQVADISRIPLFIFPIITYFAGRCIRVNYLDLVKISKILIIVFTIHSIYAIIDVLIFDETVWRDVLQQERYLIEIKNYSGGIYKGVIGNFFFDPWVLKMRRAIGMMGDPLSYAYSAILPMCFIAYSDVTCRYSKFRKALYFLVGFAGIVMSMTRAVILSSAAVLTIRRLPSRWFLPALTVVAIILLFFLSTAGYVVRVLVGLNDSSTFGHLESLKSFLSLDTLHILFGNILANPAGNPAAFESGFLNYIIVLGLFMALLFYSFITLIIHTLLKSSLPMVKAIGICGAIGLFTSYIFSESFFSFTGYGLFWLFAGMAIGLLHDKRYKS